MKTNPFINPNFDFTNIDSSKLSESFYSQQINQFNKDTREKSESYWIKNGQTKALNLFKQAALHVPAYKNFLKTHKINASKIKSIEDFSKVPTTDKENYFTKYSLSDLSWNGTLKNITTTAFSSGSSGKPYFWPRSSYQDYESAFAFEHLLTSLFQIDKHKTLLVDCFSMGGYVAGTYVYGATKLVASKIDHLTVISPGINYHDTFAMLQKLAGEFDQIILCGYPPFLRDLVQLAQDYNFDFKKHQIKFLFASEFFSENWRENTLSLSGVKKDDYFSSTNIYGTADSAIFCFETPITILIRKLTKKSSGLQQDLFNSDLTPTLVQYNPLLMYFEAPGNNLTLTSSSGLPLIRYDLKDRGGLLNYKQIKGIFGNHNIDLDQKAKDRNIFKTKNNFPFLFLTNRVDGAASFYAINIFPEYIGSVLETGEIQQKTSGKFTLNSSHDDQLNPQLEVHIELQKDTKKSKSLESIIQNKIVENLLKHCREYSFLSKSIGKKALPKIILHTKGESSFFEIGIKQKWIINKK